MVQEIVIDYLVTIDLTYLQTTLQNLIAIKNGKENGYLVFTICTIEIMLHP